MDEKGEMFQREEQGPRKNSVSTVTEWLTTYGHWKQMAWLQVLAYLLPNCLAFAKITYFIKPQFPHLYAKITMTSTLQLVMSTYPYNACKGLSEVSSTNESDHIRASGGTQLNSLSLLHMGKSNGRWVYNYNWNWNNRIQNTRLFHKLERITINYFSTEVIY